MQKKIFQIALEEAKRAFEINEVPVGAIIVKDGEIISKAHNRRKKLNKLSAHAEIIAIEKAVKKLGDWRLNDCDMYVTLEPCPMCAGAILQSRIKNLYIGTTSNIKSNSEIVHKILNNDDYYNKVNIIYINDKTSAKILTDFFIQKRQ